MDPKRRSFLAKSVVKGVEFAATAPLIGLVVWNQAHGRRYHDVNTDDLLIQAPQEAKKFCGMHDRYFGALDALAKAYNDEYHKSRRTYSFTKEKWVTEYYWDVPKELPDEDVIDSWKSDLRSFRDRCSHMASSKAIDIDRFSELKVEEIEASRAGQAFLNLGVYGGEIGALLLYEEAAVMMQYAGIRKISMSEAVERTNTRGQIARRSFLKCLAAGVGATAAYKVFNRNIRNTEQTRSELEKQIEEAGMEIDVRNEDAFSRYFGAGHLDIAPVVKNRVRSASDARSKTKEAKVKNAFEGVIASGNDYVAKLDEYFADGVPTGLAEFATCLYITDKIESLASDSWFTGNLGILVEGLAVGGAMAAILIPGEVLNARLAK